jgi:hypothetical protein
VITLEEFVERLCRVGADRGPRAFPRSGRDRDVMILSVVLSLDSGRSYTEREINDALNVWRRDVAPAIDIDHVTLRRRLVDYGRLERTEDGRAYRVGFPPRAVAFDLRIYDVDLPATIAAYLEHASKDARRRRGEAGEMNDEPAFLSASWYDVPMKNTRKNTSPITVVLVALLALALPALAHAQAKPKPNILILWGDDIGYWNLSAYNQGMMGYKTPNIDRIAKEGALFTDWYGQQSCTLDAPRSSPASRPSARASKVAARRDARPAGARRHDRRAAEGVGHVTAQFGKNHLGDLTSTRRPCTASASSRARPTT